MQIGIQDYVAYEDSLLWSLHRDYYQQEGLDAFLRQEVPYNISSNPCLAAQSLRLLLASRPDPTQALNVLEIGAGLGVFAHNFLRAVEAVAPEQTLCYWLSDYSDAGLQQLAAHPVFADWYASGRLAFCRLDGEAPEQARDLAGKPLSLPAMDLIIANYVFSTLPTAVLMRQPAAEGGHRWLRQQTRIDWQPLGAQPDPAELASFGALIAAQLRGYRLLDHIPADHANYRMFTALQESQDRVADALESSTDWAGSDDFASWLTKQLAEAWARALSSEADSTLRDSVTSLLMRPLLLDRAHPPEQLAERHKFEPESPEQLFANPEHQAALASLLGDWPLASVGYSPAGLTALNKLLGLCRPEGLILLNDKAYADAAWMASLTPEAATRHGQSLAHPVNFPLFEAVLTRQGHACLRTSDQAQALHSLLIGRASALADTVARQFTADFIDYPRNEISHALLEGGHALMQAERLEQATRTLQRALGYRPEDGTLQYLSAVCLLNQEKYPEALALLARPHDDLFGLFNREILQAESYRLLEQYELAIPAYLASLRHGENSQTYYNLALCQIALGQAQAARTSLLRAQALDPEDEEVGELLGEIGAGNEERATRREEIPHQSSSSS